MDERKVIELTDSEISTVVGGKISESVQNALMTKVFMMMSKYSNCPGYNDACSEAMDLFYAKSSDNIDHGLAELNDDLQSIIDKYGLK